MGPCRTITVTMEEGVNMEYAKTLANAIRCFRGVLDVTTIEADGSELFAVQNARSQIAKEMRKVLWPSMSD